MIEELKKNVEAILDQFAKEEIGNRNSQFSMIALKMLILQEIDKFTPKPEGKKEPDNV
jgi:hypothetical protein